MQTSFMESHASDVRNLAKYLDKEQGLEDHRGLSVDEAQVAEFAEQAEQYNTARMITFSPKESELSDEELSAATRSVMGEYRREGRHSLRYVYGIHRDTEHPHTQLCVVGNDEDIEMDTEDLAELTQLSMREFEPEQQQEQEAALVQEDLTGDEIDDLSEVAESHLSRVQATLPSNEQLAEQSVFSEIDVASEQEIEQDNEQGVER